MNCMHAPTRALVIGAKAPVSGTVKTRLGRTIGTNGQQHSTMRFSVILPPDLRMKRHTMCAGHMPRSRQIGPP